MKSTNNTENTAIYKIVFDTESQFVYCMKPVRMTLETEKENVIIKLFQKKIKLDGKNN